MLVVGIDGCKFGWVAVGLKLDGTFYVSKHKTINEIFEKYSNAKRFLVDMVIGLSDASHPRDIEQLAREKLKPNRTSSVFTPPCRKAVYSESYEQAKTINIEELGKSISIQAWNIVAKIKELDVFLLKNKSLQKRIWEAHPEICFAALNNGKPMLYKKSIKEGAEERLAILQKTNPISKEIFQKGINDFLRKEVKKDDLLDAICLAVNGLLGEEGEYEFISSEKNKFDREGLEMKMCCWKM